MASSKKEVEEQLQQAGHSLLKLPSNSDDLLKLLDEVEVLLSAVGQAPSTSMQDALLPTMTALISDVLLQHSDMDVKVSVASCITEITRITAPDAPYDDDQMKVIFKLIGAAIENVSNLSGRCYKKAVSILKIVAKVRSTVMMLDLGCYTLIAEMFQQFLNIIQSDHPLAVFSDMETIMITVLDEIHETEEIPLEILKFFLSSVRMENQKISPFSWKLGVSVLNNCAAKLRFYLFEAVKSMGTSLDDYAPVVSSICQSGSHILKLYCVVKNQVTEAVRVNAKESSPLKPKSRGRPRKYPAKVVDERAITSVHADTGKSSAVPCMPEKNQQESALNLETENINPSPVQKVGTGPVSATRPRGRPRNLAPKSNQETFLASPRLVVTAESPFLSGPKLKPEQKPASQAGTGSIKDVGTDADGSLSKILKSEIKAEGDTVEVTPKIIRKRKPSIGKEVENPMPDPDDRLVGKGIKVWWPQDKKFYNGVVRSYDFVRKKHLVIYTDGEKENLNLRKQRWQLIGDDSGDTHIQPCQMKDSPKTADSDIVQKRKRKRKTESSMRVSGGFALKRISGTGTGASAGLSTVERMKSDGNSADRSTRNEHIEEGKSNDIDRMMNDDDDISAGELKVDMKTGMDSVQITPEAVTGSRKENPKVGIEPSVSGVVKEMTELKTHFDLQTTPKAMILSKEENPKVDVKAFDTKGMTELSNGTNDASSPSSPVLDKAV